MARTDALSIYTNVAGSTADKLAESYGKVIESIQKGALSEQLKNKDYSGTLSTWRPNQSEASAVVDCSNRCASIIRAFVFIEMTI